MGKGKSEKPAKLSSKEYEKELERLQGELVKLQLWVKEKGLKVIVVFEGRDAVNARMGRIFTLRRPKRILAATAVKR